MARDFAALGRNLALCARRAERLAELRAELLDRHPGITVTVRELDVTDHGRVFEVFRGFRDELGTLDRVIVNAGLGKGQPVGTGRFDANAETAQTNFTAALAQCEAAVEIFRDQGEGGAGSGHLVVISSMSALRGMPRNMTAYAASKAGVSALAEGIRADLWDTPIAVSTICPGYIVSDLSVRAGRSPLVASTEKGVRSMVRAIERERATAMVPAWPWVPLGLLLRALPLRVVRRLT